MLCDTNSNKLISAWFKDHTGFGSGSLGNQTMTPFGFQKTLILEGLLVLCGFAETCMVSPSFFLFFQLLQEDFFQQLRLDQREESTGQGLVPPWNHNKLQLGDPENQTKGTPDCRGFLISFLVIHTHAMDGVAEVDSNASGSIDRPVWAPAGWQENKFKRFQRKEAFVRLSPWQFSKMSWFSVSKSTTIKAQIKMW